MDPTPERLCQPAYTRYSEGDFAGLLELFDPEVEVFVAPPNFESGTYRGHDQYRALLERWAASWDEMRITPVRISGAGDWVLALVEYAGRGKGSAQFHCNVWGAGESAWLPPGAWAACRSGIETDDGTPLWLGIDIGGSRSASAVVGVTQDLEVAVCEVFQGDAAVLQVAESVRALAERFELQEIVFDPFRFQGEAPALPSRSLRHA